MSIDPLHFRHTLGHFATGVAIITTRDGDGVPWGVTVNSFTSVSLEPPLVLFCLDEKALSLPAFTHSGRFAVAVLSEPQTQLSRSFAKSPRDPWDTTEYEEQATGSPILKGALAWLDCRTRSVERAGDHFIVLGQVEALGHAGDGKPLLYWRGGYRAIDGGA